MKARVACRHLGRTPEVVALEKRGAGKPSEHYPYCGSHGDNVYIYTHILAMTEVGITWIGVTVGWWL